jgi:hypothetical protein
VKIFFRAEDCYFGNWPNQTAEFEKLYGFVPGEFKLYQGLFGTSPSPARSLKDPMLDGKGRQLYKDGLVSILKDLPGIRDQCDDGGRLANIERAINTTLILLNTIG